MIDTHNGRTAQFEAERPRLRAMAYRMLGSLTEAEDAVQEAWLHLSRSDTRIISNLGGWLTTVVARICLNMLHTRASRHEESLEASAPAPIVSHEGGTDPEGRRNWLIQWVWRCWWSLIHFLPLSASLSSCTISSPCLSMKLLLLWNVLRWRPGSLPAGLAVACGDRQWRKTPIWPISEKLLMPSSPPRVKVPLIRCWRCSPRISWSELTRLPCPEAR